MSAAWVRVGGRGLDVGDNRHRVHRDRLADGSGDGLAGAVDTYDRIFPAGYITANGSTQARLVLIHG